MTPVPEPPVLRVDLHDVTRVGNKFARLESMRLAGLPVPPLYCLPAEAFDLVVGKVRDGLPAVPPLGDAGAVKAWGEAATAEVTRLAVPGELADAALAAFDEVIGPDGLAAVRACVVPAAGLTGEDDAADPFAGMSDSFLYVPRRDLLTRIVDCWASAYKPEAVLYRLRAGADPTATRVAVGVQLMVPGTRSFVAFSRDPRDGSARHVIAAALGIGEGVVQEKADVDHFFVSHATGEVTERTVRKNRMVGPPDGSGELALLAVPDELAGKPVLDRERISRIVEALTRIERHFGCPQDVEGTFTEDGRLYVVQARPMAEPPEERPRTRQVLWSNHNITESYPGVSGALTYSLARDFYRWIFTDLYRRMGVSERSLRRDRHHLERMVGMVDGRVFYRLDAWYALHGRLPVFEFVRGWWEHSMGLADDPRSVPPCPGWPLRALRIAPGYLRRALRHPRDVREFLTWWDGTAATAHERIDHAEPAELVAFYRRLWAQVAVRWGVTLTNSVFSMTVAGTLDRLLRRWAGQDGRALMLGLLSGGPDNRSLAALRSAIALAELVGANGPARERVLAAERPEDARRAWEELVEGRYGSAIAGAAVAHLRRYGDRAAGDLKLEEPTPRQRPWMVLDMVRPFVRQGLTVAASRAEELRVRREAERELRERCPGLLRRTALRLLAAAMRGLVKAREDTRFCRTELYGLSRGVLFRLGAELAKAGHLDRADDVIDLTVQEVLGAFEGTLPGADLRPLAAHRRKEREFNETLPAPPSRLLTGEGLARDVGARRTEPREQEGDPRLLRGLASSAGLVRARAKVVPHPSIPPEACQDRILIARETDPGWLFLMSAARGLVVERGTLLSHTAITGRLLGVPTVVAVAGATTRIPDGALIELDGAAGTVRVLDEAPEEGEG
ncbi:PEP/pyruvate-binding domain-containing protein [Streptosporangium jomthongense]|uniref:PEP/pyruvate-binding domain-containing protein n=1 Tax=Streptosporangium jomthongense TaxID=1193683 RepID=A0ABV8EWQ9_9ACTN